MSIEQQFVDLIKEGNVADAMQLIKDNLTEQAGQSIVDSKFEIAEGYGMKKKGMKESDKKDKKDMSEEDDEDYDSKSDDDAEDDEENKDKDKDE